ncbi:Rid family detoxifying hydrolase [bacterium]|nr:Rid family detoxifying hydrolase [bacterium]
MSEKVSIWAENAPKAFGHYCQAIKMGNQIHMSGQLPLDPATGKPTGGDIKAQTKQVFDNMTAILQACGAQLSHILSTRVYLVDLRDFPAFDEVSKEYFYFLPPARTTLAVPALPGGCRVCVEAVAEMPPVEKQGPSMI